MTERSWWGAELLGRGATDAVWASAHDEVTFGALRKEVDWLAEALGSYGIRSGDTVALHGSSSFTQLWALFALWSLGVQVLLLDPRLGARERDALLDLSNPRFLVSLGELNEHKESFVDECEVLVRRRRGGRPAATGHCVVQFSSGATGRAKAIGRTPESLLEEVGRLRALDGMPTAGERVAVLEPVSHSFALIGGLLHALAVQATVLFPMRQSPQGVAAAVARAHVAIGSPWHFRWLADHGSPLPDLRVAISGGEALARKDANAFGARYGVRVGQAYGTTETGIVAADLAGRFGPSSVGLPVPGVRTRVADGVLQVQLPQSPYLYQGPPAPGGWLSTNDLATVDARTGALRLRGRASGGAHPSVDLLEIEHVLRAHQHVTDAVVLGVDAIEAHVAGPDHLDQSDLRSWCLRFLGHQASPSRYHIVRELPRTAGGKAVRDHSRLRQLAGAPKGAATIGGDQ